jgi:hypothetical protein
MTNKSPVNLIEKEEQASRFPRARVRDPLTHPLHDTRNTSATQPGDTEPSSQPGAVPSDGAAGDPAFDRAHRYD